MEIEHNQEQQDINNSDHIKVVEQADDQLPKNPLDNLELESILENLKDVNIIEDNINTETRNQSTHESTDNHKEENINIENHNPNANNENKITMDGKLSTSYVFDSPIKKNLGEVEIKSNLRKSEMNYDSLFRPDPYGISSPSKNNSCSKRSSVIVEELKSDSSLLRKSLIAQKDEFIKPEDWDLKIEEIEENFKMIEEKINRADLYNLFETVKKLNLFSNYSKVNNDKPVSIGPVSTLEYMVESTFGFDSNQASFIIEHILSLEKIIFRWRSILGDGNCYYRAVIFAFLEKIILDKNIILLKKVMTEINEKFDENYPNTRNLKFSNRQEISNLNKPLIMKIFYLIYEILDQNNPESASTAYDILLKSFVFCQSFDTAMILYFRYKIYEFIKENWNKVYTKDFSVKIGNLLPNEYETEYGDFLYDKFFEEQLMKIDTDAEKIVIYLTPFVLKINLNIIIYEFDTDSNATVREFPCYLENKQNIWLLYRKTHYDLVYESKNFEKYAKELCSYVNLNENLVVIKNGILDEMRNGRRSEGVSPISKKLTYSENSNDNNNNQHDPNINSSDNSENPFPKCSNCNNFYLHQPNILNLCINCLTAELESQMMANYLLYISECLSSYQEENDTNIPKIFNEVFNVREISFFNKPITLNRLVKLTDKSLKDVITDVKDKICVICTQNIDYTNKNNTPSYFYKLPCSCVLCCKNCFKTYFSLVFHKNKLGKNFTKCICGQNFNNQDYKKIYEFLELNKLKDYKKIIESFVIANISRVCIGGCMDDVRYSKKEFFTLKLKDPELTRVYKIKEFKHVICEDCLKYMKKIKEKEDIECILCNLTHKVVKITNGGDDDCNIL